MKQHSVTTLKTVTAAVALTLGGTLLSGTVDLDSGTVLAAQGSGQGSGGQGSGGQGGGSQRPDSAGQGQQGAGGTGGQGGASQVPEGISAEDEDGEDSDRPDWAGGGGKGDTGKPEGAGTMKGDLYGDLWVILRDENGVPILSEDGFVQPVDADGNPIPLDEEGHPVDESLVQEVEFGRLNVGRAPDRVTGRAYDEAMATLDSGTQVFLDETGRLTVELDDGTTKTIDSPIENLALYITLMTEGYIPGLEDNENLASELEFLKSGSDLTAEDLSMASKLLAASADKFGTLTVDQVAYFNNIVGISDMMDPEDYQVYDGFDYVRSDAYGDQTITWYEKDADGNIITHEDDPLMDAVFGGADYATPDVDGFVDYSQAADDALQVIEFIHEYVPFD